MSWRLATRTARRPGARWWISFAAIAAAVAGMAYFFDRRLRERPAPLNERWPEEPPPDVDSEDAVEVRHAAGSAAR